MLGSTYGGYKIGRGRGESSFNMRRIATLKKHRCIKAMQASHRLLERMTATEIESVVAGNVLRMITEK
jgi:hypothetical protein